MNDLLSAICQHLISDIPLPEKFALVDSQTPQLNQQAADELVDCLKTHADRFRLQGNSGGACESGTLIVRIGECRQWFTYQGIGYMVCGDAYNYDYRYDLAWVALEKAGQLHRQAATAGEPEADFNWSR